MNRRQRKSALVLAVLGFSVVPTVRGQVIDTWTGSTNTSWGELGNWNAAVPTSIDEALFNNSGNSNTAITLGGPFSAASIEFDSGASAYTIGGSGDTLSLTGSGTLVSLTGGTSQAINSSITLSGNGTFSNSSNLGLTFGSSSTPGIISLPASSTLTVLSNKGGTITINDSIQGSGANVILPGSPISYTTGSTVVFAGSSNYSGTTTQSSGNSLTIQIASSTDTANNSTFTYGPFGTSTVVFNNTLNSPLQAVGADQTVANTLSLQFGFTVTNASTPHNLSFTGPIVLNSSGRTITDNGFGQTLTLGSASNPSTITLPTGSSQNVAIFPSAQNNGASPAGASATLIINDVIQEATGYPNGFIIGPANNQSNPMGIIQLNGANTCTGTVQINGQAGTQTPSNNYIQGMTVQVGVNSIGAGSSVTSGAFGTGMVKWNGNSNSPGYLEPFGADRTIGNNMTLASGFVVQEPSTFQDPTATTPHNLTLTGNITSAAQKIITNDLPSGAVLTLGSAASPAAIDASASNVAFVVQSQLTTASGGGVTVINDVIQDTASYTGALIVQNGGTVKLMSTNTYHGGTTVKNAALLTTATNFSNGSLTLNVGTLGGAKATVLAQPTPGATAGVTAIPSLTIDGTTATSSQLDITNNGLILSSTTTTSFTQMRSYIISGAAVSGGSATFTGPGITSSTAAAVEINGSDAHKTAIGYANASDLGLVSGSTFLGNTLTDNSAVLVRYTLAGDANLDGVVNALDFNALATHYGESDGNGNWDQGDYNYDGNVNSTDFDLLAGNFGLNINNVPSSSQPLAALGQVVPEPTSLGILGMSLIALRRRRRMK